MAVSPLFGAAANIGNALIPQNRLWKLVSIDRTDEDSLAPAPPLTISGQFQLEGYTEDVGVNLGIVNSQGSSFPGVHFQSDDTDNISFRARIFRTSPISSALVNPLADPFGSVAGLFSNETPAGDGSIKEYIDTFKRAAKKVEELGRSRKFVFTYGSEIKEVVMIKSIGGISYDSLRSDGTIRGASFNVSLIKIQETTPIPASASLGSILKSIGGAVATLAGTAVIGRAAAHDLVQIPGASVHTVSKRVRAKRGDSFELIAKREYKNALLGDVLRRAQPEKLNFGPGDEIKIVSRNEIVQIAVTPQSIPLRDNVLTKALLDSYLAFRKQTATLAG